MPPMPVPACGIWAPSENGDASGGSVGGQRLCGAFTRGRAAAPREPARAPDCSAHAQTRARRPHPWPQPRGGSQGLWDTGGQSGLLLLQAGVSV